MKTITSVGHPPLLVKNLAGTIKFHSAGKVKVTKLDANGYPSTSLSSDGTITLDPTTLYYLLER
jgi:hypothetical protein